MREIGHFIAGKPVAGTSGKFGDVFNPAAGEVTARVALADAAEVNKAVDRRRRSLAGLGRHPAAAPRPCHVQAEGTAGARPPGIRRHHHRRARQGPVGRRWRGAARPGGGGVCLRHPASAEGRIHRSRRHRHRRLVDPPAARRRRRHHPVQLPADGAAVDDPGGACLRQLLHPEAVGEGPVRVAEAGRAAGRGRACRTACSTWCRARARRWRRSWRIPASPRSASWALPLSPRRSIGAARRTASACRRWAGRRTTWW